MLNTIQMLCQRSKFHFHIIGLFLYMSFWLSKRKSAKCNTSLFCLFLFDFTSQSGERGGSVVECRTPEREVRGSRPTSAVLCPWARHFTPRKYWLITQEAMAPSRHDWKIVDWDVKPQHNQQPTSQSTTMVMSRRSVGLTTLFLSG